MKLRVESKSEIGTDEESAREREMAGSHAAPLKRKGGERLRLTKFSWMAPTRMVSRAGSCGRENSETDREVKKAK